MTISTPQQSELKSICELCAQDGDCEVVNRSSVRVADCEQFQPDPALVRRLVERTMTLGMKHSRQADADRNMGLCENCDNRGRCALPGREGGVWYCEEYE